MYTEKLHILLAEDDQDDRLFFKDAFNAVKIEHTLTMFEDGNEIMDYLNNCEDLPHIVFLDLNMPGKSGIECLKEIRSNPDLRDLSVAIYSTSASNQNIEETFILGANVYIKKPKDFAALKKIISDVIHINWQYVTDGLNRENFMLSY
jgi:CheY-like chemotaxis protein